MTFRALGLAVAAVAAPSAVAAEGSGLEVQYGSANMLTEPTVVIPAGWEGRQFGPAAVSSPTAVTPVPVTDLLANPQLGPANVISEPVTPVATVGPGGFDFVDAVVGGAIAVAVMLLIAAVLVTRRRGHLARA